MQAVTAAHNIQLPASFLFSATVDVKTLWSHRAVVLAEYPSDAEAQRLVEECRKIMEKTADPEGIPSRFFVGCKCSGMMCWKVTASWGGVRWHSTLALWSAGEGRLVFGAEETVALFTVRIPRSIRETVRFVFPC